jgi:hypothetical protein
METEPMSYVAVWPCGCALAVCIDHHQHRKATAKSVARWIGQGAAIERWSMDRVRTEWPRRMPECHLHRRVDSVQDHR